MCFVVSDENTCVQFPFSKLQQLTRMRMTSALVSPGSGADDRQTLIMRNTKPMFRLVRPVVVGPWNAYNFVQGKTIDDSSAKTAVMV